MSGLDSLVSITLLKDLNRENAAGRVVSSVDDTQFFI